MLYRHSVFYPYRACVSCADEQVIETQRAYLHICNISQSRTETSRVPTPQPQNHPLKEFSKYLGYSSDKPNFKRELKMLRFLLIIPLIPKGFWVCCSLLLCLSISTLVLLLFCPACIINKQIQEISLFFSPEWWTRL